jgi:predicted site-specific integrase-resolvase
MKVEAGSLLNERAVAARLGVSMSTMRRIRRRGEIEYYRLSTGVVKYAPQQLEKFLSRHRLEASAVSREAA